MLDDRLRVGRGLASGPPCKVVYILPIPPTRDFPTKFLLRELQSALLLTMFPHDTLFERSMSASALSPLWQLTHRVFQMG